MGTEVDIGSKGMNELPSTAVTLLAQEVLLEVLTKSLIPIVVVIGPTQSQK